jgi:hypothetical protein
MLPLRAKSVKIGNEFRISLLGAKAIDNKNKLILI